MTRLQRIHQAACLPWATSLLWACWGTHHGSGGVTHPWQVAPSTPGRLDQDLVLGCCPDIQKRNGEIPDLPEVNGNLVIGSSRARTSPNAFPSLLPGECVRSGSLWPRHAAVWKPFTEPGGIAALLGKEIQWEALPVLSWVGTTRAWMWRPRRPSLLADCLPQWGWWWWLLCFWWFFLVLFCFLVLFLTTYSLHVACSKKNWP